MTARTRLTAAMVAEPPSDDAQLVLSYKGLRKAIGILGVLLPCVLLVSLFWINDHKVPGSISAFYYTSMRGYFVGTLCALGVFLFSYRYAPRDNWLSTLAAALVVFVALCPTAEHNQPRTGWNYAHLVAAGFFFVILAFMSYTLFTKKPGQKIDWGLHAWPTATREDKRDVIYRTSGLLIAAALIAALINGATKGHYLFWCEAVAVWAFSFSWLVKGDLFPFLRDPGPPPENSRQGEAAASVDVA
jgi:hypothetical protein